MSECDHTIINPDWCHGCANRRIANLEAENERLENLLAEGVHSCSKTCKRPMCVLRREKAELEQQLAEAQKQCIRLKKFRDNCVSLTGSLWPQNETTEYLSELLNGQDGVVMFEGDCDGCLDQMVPSDLRVLVAQRDRLEQQLADMTEDVKWKPMDDAPHGVWIIVSTIFETTAQACWSSNGGWTMYDNCRLTDDQVNGWMNLPTALLDQSNGS